jgi:GT2 family glycosyltransferase
LPCCLEAVSAQSFRNYEVIVVDNASTDGSADGLEARWPGVKVIRLAENLGFAAGNNLGARQARGRWLALLNNDAFPAPGWLAALVSAAEAHPEYAFFASRILQANDPAHVDATGDVYHISGHAWHRDINRPAAEAHHEMDEVFSACAAAAMYSRAAYLEAGGLEERFANHHEDVDLGFRLRLMGIRCLYVPGAVVEHIGSASYGKESNRTVYHVHRNLVWSYWTNMPAALLWRSLPAHLLANLVFLIYYSRRGQAGAIWRAKRDALLGLPAALRRRGPIQRNRRVPVAELSRVMDHGWLSPYILGRRSGKIRRALSLGRSDQ